MMNKGVIAGRRPAPGGLAAPPVPGYILWADPRVVTVSNGTDVDAWGHADGSPATGGMSDYGQPGYKPQLADDGGLPYIRFQVNRGKLWLNYINDFVMPGGTFELTTFGSMRAQSPAVGRSISSQYPNDNWLMGHHQSFGEHAGYAGKFVGAPINPPAQNVWRHYSMRHWQNWDVAFYSDGVQQGPTETGAPERPRIGFCFNGYNKVGWDETWTYDQGPAIAYPWTMTSIEHDDTVAYLIDNTPT